MGSFVQSKVAGAPLMHREMVLPWQAPNVESKGVHVSFGPLQYGALVMLSMRQARLAVHGKAA